MKHYRRLLVLALLALLAAGGFVAWKMMQPPPDGLDLALVKPSKAGLFRVAVAPESGRKEKGVLHAWTVEIKDAAGNPVNDARIAVDGGMPQHGHGLPTEPKAGASLGNGRYRIEGVRFNMGGWWVLRLGIEAGGKKDDVEFNIVL
jgi:hypothetical protein